MMARIDDEAKRALWAMDLAERGLPGGLEDQAKALLELNRILNLLSIRYKLKEGWGKYVSDEAVRRFGEKDAGAKIRAARNRLLLSLSGKGGSDLRAISETTRRMMLEQRLVDYEPPMKPAMAGLYKKLYEIGDYAQLKVNLFTPLPFVMMAARDRKNIFSLDKFYVDDKTRELFEDDAKTAEAMESIVEGVAYIRGSKTDWRNMKELRDDGRAVSIARNIFKMFHKNAKAEALKDRSLQDALELFNGGLLEQGLVRLANHPVFAPTIKNMTNIYLAEFSPKYVQIFSAEGRCRLYLDELGKANIVNGIEKHRGMGISYLYAAALLFNYLLARLRRPRRMVFNKNLKLCVEALDRNEPAEENRIQSVAIDIFASAAFNNVLWLGEGQPKRVGQAAMGIRRLVITLPETKRRIKLALMDTTVFDTSREGPSVHDENALVYNSLLYASATLLYPETGIMDFNFYTTPEVEALFDNFTEEVKFDAKFAGLISKAMPIRTAKPVFRFESRGGYDSVIGSACAAMLMKEYARRG